MQPTEANFDRFCITYFPKFGLLDPNEDTLRRKKTTQMKPNLQTKCHSHDPDFILFFALVQLVIVFPSFSSNLSEIVFLNWSVQQMEKTWSLTRERDGEKESVCVCVCVCVR